MLVALMAIGVVDVIGRYLIGMPMKECYGLSEVLLVGIVFFSWPYTQSIGGNVKVEFFYERFHPWTQSALGVISSVIAIFIFGIMAWQSALKALDSMEFGEIIDVIMVPVYPFQFFVTVGVIFLCLQLTVEFLQFLGGVIKER
jgi:TRAP-type mannitol/chloroaromatic compound transport system permease small subunit